MTQIFSGEDTVLDPTDHQVIADVFETSRLSSRFTRRVLQMADAQAYVAFDTCEFIECNPETPTDHQPSQPFDPVDIREAMAAGDIFEAIYEGDTMVATMWFTPQPDRSNLHISNIVVAHTLRGEGIGSYFLDAAHTFASARNFETCDLHVDPLNQGGMNLYINRNGYQVTGYETNEEDGLKHWVIATRKKRGAERDVFPLHEAGVWVASGDEAGLQTVIDSEYVGTEYRAGNTPRSGILKFLKVVD